MLQNCHAEELHAQGQEFHAVAEEDAKDWHAFFVLDCHSGTKKVKRISTNESKR